MASFWSMLKLDSHGTFHHVNAKHLHYWANAVVTRHNMRGRGTVDMMHDTLAG